ncbi:MAG: STAS-like domain-containing protein [Candidatus Thermoplasmatota archaeon]|nr:STAS-like domain-containing protein [Candidatus Thermoplasmatota archaeon]
MTEIMMLLLVGDFAENKDTARDIRTNLITPAIEKGEEVILDFKGVALVTQSFIHALISELLRRYGREVLDVLLFKNCNEDIRKIIGIVVDYMQESE